MAKKEVFSYTVSVILIIAGLCLLYFTVKQMFVSGSSLIDELVFVIGIVLLITGINIIRVRMGKKEIKLSRAGPAIKEEHAVRYQWFVAAVFGVGLIFLMISAVKYNTHLLWKILFFVSAISMGWAIFTSRFGYVVRKK